MILFGIGLLIAVAIIAEHNLFPSKTDQSFVNELKAELEQSDKVDLNNIDVIPKVEFDYICITYPYTTILRNISDYFDLNGFTILPSDLYILEGFWGVSYISTTRKVVHTYQISFSDFKHPTEKSYGCYEANSTVMHVPSPQKVATTTVSGVALNNGNGQKRDLSFVPLELDENEILKFPFLQNIKDENDKYREQWEANYQTDLTLPDNYPEVKISLAENITIEANDYDFFLIQ